MIVSYHVRDLLRACLAALPAAAEGLTLQVVVVDNGSRDGTAEMVRGEFPAVELIESGANEGFARATNRGLAAARGDVLAWLNPDCVAAPGSLSRLVRRLRERPEVGAIGPRLVYPDGRIQPSAQAFLGPHHVLFHFLGLRALSRVGPVAAALRRLPRGLSAVGHGYLDAIEPSAEEREVDWVSGACLVTRAEVSRRVGPLDEGYFMYCEDADWCHRVHDAGFRVVYLPESVVVHHVGASGRGSGSPFVTFHYYRSLLRYFRRHRAGDLGWVRAFMTAGFTWRGLGCELRRLVGRRVEHPWWRLARLSVAGVPDEEAA